MIRAYCQQNNCISLEFYGVGEKGGKQRQIQFSTNELIPNIYPIQRFGKTLKGICVPPIVLQDISYKTAPKASICLDNEGGTHSCDQRSRTVRKKGRSNSRQAFQ